MLAARLQAFEDMFNHGGAELAEQIARDSTTLGNLITRHLAEFDRTVKTYGGEMVERLGERTQEVSSAMRDYLDNFDTRVSTKSAEVTASLDQQFARFQDALDSRTQTLNEPSPPVLPSPPVMDIAKTLAEGGKEVVGALDKRIGDVTGVINARGAEARRKHRRQDRRHRQGARRQARWRSPTISTPASAASRSCCSAAPRP